MLIKILSVLVLTLSLALVGTGLLLKQSYKANGELSISLTAAQGKLKACKEDRAKDQSFKTKQTEIMQDLFTKQDDLEDAYTSLLAEFEKGASNGCQVVKEIRNESKSNPIQGDVMRVDFTIDRGVFDTAACTANNNCHKPQ